MFTRREVLFCFTITLIMAALVLLSGCSKKSLDPEPTNTTDTWMKTYGGNQGAYCGDILPTDDGGYFIVGATSIQWEPERRGDVYLIRTDAAGVVLWEKSYGGEGYDEGMAITQANDGGVVIAGQTMSFGADGIDAYLFKVDPDGNEIWSKTFGDSLDEWISEVHQTTDGGYILMGFIVDPNDIIADPGAAGYGGLEGRSNVYMIKTDSDGNELWSHVYASENNILTSSGFQTPDGGFLILATIMYFPASDNDIYVLKVNGNGNEVWSRTWDQGMSSGYDLIQTSDGNYLATGPYSPPEHMEYTKNDYQFIKFDPVGNEIWTSTFGDPDISDYAKVLVETMDGGYIGVGGTGDILLVKIDENGQRVWEQQISTDPNTHSGFAAILQHPDGGYVIAGSTFRAGTTDIFLIKTDSEGRVEQ